MLLALAVGQEGAARWVAGRAHPARKSPAAFPLVVLSVPSQTKALATLAARKPLLFVRVDVVLWIGKCAQNIQSPECHAS